MSDYVWDGQLHSYRPADDWKTRVSTDLRFHEDEAMTLDPITYEVIRHRLWTINTAHGEMVTRISGSPVFQGLDFNMCILTEDAEVVMNAPYIQYLDSGAPLAITYILEKYSDEPGIREGDLFVCNDPWIGAVHQMDVLYAMPVFVDERLFAWVSNAGHQYDLGGVAAGGWPERAVDVFHDPVVMPPFKLIEQGRLRPDLEAMYLRHSRFPGLIALDLRAQVAGCRFAAEQLVLACEEYGPEIVKASMKRILNTAQEVFRQKLLRIPDSKWTEVLYFDEKLPGDRHTQRVQLNIEKRGDRLIVDNCGTQEQEEGPNGMTYAALTGTVLGAITLTMLQDQLFAMGGAVRQVDFKPVPGLLNCVDHPAAVSGGVLNVVAMLHRTMALLARMLACDPEQAQDAVLPGVEIGLAVIAGSDETGRPFGSAFLEQPGGAGATAWRDGIDTAGFVFAPLIRYPNVEENESFYPVVILWRKQLVDSGAPGRWRGGGGTHFGAMEYRSTSLDLSTNTGAMAISGSGACSIMGAYPGSTIAYELLRETDVYEKFKSKTVPTGLGELLAASRVRLRGKSSDNRIDRTDVFSARFPGGAGYGDPLLREPERVGADVAEGWVSIEAAVVIYGVVSNSKGEVDYQETKDARAAILAARQRWDPVDPDGQTNAAVEPLLAAGEAAQKIHEYIMAVDQDGHRVLACARCSQEIAPYRGNYKAGLLVDVGSVEQIPLVDNPSFYLDDEIEFRRYCCPNCQVLMNTEVVKSGEPHLPEMSFA